MGFKSYVVKNAVPILLGGAMVSGVAATVAAVHGTAKAVRKLEEAGLDKHSPKKEVVKCVWKEYIPTAVFTVSMIACGIAALRTSGAHMALATSMAQAATLSADEYRRRLQDRINNPEEFEKVDKEVKEAVRDSVPEKKKDIIMNNIGGKDLIFDRVTGQLFRSTKTDVANAVGIINSDLAGGFAEASLNDFLSLIGACECEAGYHIGWNSEHPLTISWDSDLIDGEPVLTLDYGIYVY